MHHSPSYGGGSLVGDRIEADKPAEAVLKGQDAAVSRDLDHEGYILLDSRPPEMHHYTGNSSFHAVVASQWGAVGQEEGLPMEVRR